MSWVTARPVSTPPRGLGWPSINTTILLGVDSPTREHTRRQDLTSSLFPRLLCGLDSLQAEKPPRPPLTDPRVLRPVGQQALMRNFRQRQIRASSPPVLLDNPMTPPMGLSEPSSQMPSPLVTSPKSETVPLAPAPVPASHVGRCWGEQQRVPSTRVGRGWSRGLEAGRGAGVTVGPRPQRPRTRILIQLCLCDPGPQFSRLENGVTPGVSLSKDPHPGPRG